MELLESVEVRWFLPSNDPKVAGFEDWFRKVPVEDDKRTDFYYVDLSKPDINAKERTGASRLARLEFKYRVGTLGTTRLAPNLLGHLERWTKISTDIERPAISSDPRCIEIRKQRRLRKFSFTGDMQITEVAVSERPDAGCGVEFTKVEAVREGASRLAFTFGLEAFGPSPVGVEALQGTIQVLCAERSRLRLDAAQSMNYSDWILMEFAGEL